MSTDLDFAIIFPAEYGQPNAVMANKSVLATHSDYLRDLFVRKPDVDAYRIRTKVLEDDIRAILRWMQDPLSIEHEGWPRHVLGNRYLIARKLKMKGLVDAISQVAVAAD